MFDEGGESVLRAKTNPLSSAEQVGFIGDLHGDLGSLLGAARTLRVRNVDVVIVVGDFGFVWPGVNYRRTLDKISRRLSMLDTTLYFVDGNHEWFPELHSYAIEDDGLRRLRDNVIHLPRGYRTEIASGKTLAALGGANSIDRDDRVNRTNWWREESVTEADLAELGSEPVDVLVGHDAPLGLIALDQMLAENKLDLSTEMIEYSRAGRTVLSQALGAVRPSLYVGGHYHYPIDEVLGLPGTSGERPTRVILLDQVGRHAACLAVLNGTALTIETRQIAAT